MPPCFSSIYIFLMVRGYYIYKDIWQWQIADLLPCSEAYLPVTTCCLSASLPYCPVGFHVLRAYFITLHFPQPQVLAVVKIIAHSMKSSSEINCPKSVSYVVQYDVLLYLLHSFLSDFAGS